MCYKNVSRKQFDVYNALCIKLLSLGAKTVCLMFSNLEKSDTVNQNTQYYHQLRSPQVAIGKKSQVNSRFHTLWVTILHTEQESTDSAVSSIIKTST